MSQVSLERHPLVSSLPHSYLLTKKDTRTLPTEGQGVLLPKVTEGVLVSVRYNLTLPGEGHLFGGVLVSVRYTK